MYQSITKPYGAWVLILDDLRPRYPQETALLETVVTLAAGVQEVINPWDEVTAPVPLYLTPFIPDLVAHPAWVDAGYWEVVARRIAADRTHDVQFYQRKKERGDYGNRPILA